MNLAADEAGHHDLLRNHLAQVVFDGTLSSSPRLARLAGRLRQAMLRFADPLVEYELNGRPLLLRMSHQLPAYQRQCPTYSQNLARLASFVRAESGPLTMIDVGANVGDSFCLADPQPGDRFLLVEGADEYFEVLHENTKQFAGATLVPMFLSDEDGDTSYQVDASDGTGRLVAGEASTTVACQTLDSLVNDNPEFREVNLLKIDVDGFDGKVLRGAERTIRGARPVLFFEHSPRHLRAVGEDAMSIFEHLVEWGYGEVLLYDNLGFLVGLFTAMDRDTLAKLIAYAVSRKDYYFDICCVHDDDPGLRTKFLQHEQRFFEGLARER